MKSLISLLLLISSLSAFSSDRAGNGGGGHVCPDSVELYDFYEAKSPFLPFQIPVWESRPDLSVEEYLEKAISHLAETHPGIEQGIRKRLKELLSVPYEELVLPIRIPWIPDADISIVDENCTYEPVANWNERLNRIFFTRKLFERMDNMSKAGLYLHEVIYKAGRDLQGIQHSNDVRTLVARIFSNSPVPREEVKAVVGPNVLSTVPMSGKCEIEFIFSPEKDAECVRGEGKMKMRIGKAIRLSKADDKFTTSCGFLHREGKIRLEYEVYAFSMCRIEMRINGEAYPFSVDPYPAHSGSFEYKSL